MKHSSKPVKKFRACHLEVAVWANVVQTEGETFTRYSCTMKKSIKVEGDWKETNVIFPNEIPIAMMLLNETYQWIYIGRKDESD